LAEIKMAKRLIKELLNAGNIGLKYAVKHVGMENSRRRATL
jgi:hypothetical protein